MSASTPTTAAVTGTGGVRDPTKSPAVVPLSSAAAQQQAVNHKEKITSTPQDYYQLKRAERLKRDKERELIRERERDRERDREREREREKEERVRANATQVFKKKIKGFKGREVKSEGAERDEESTI